MLFFFGLAKSVCRTQHEKGSERSEGSFLLLAARVTRPVTRDDLVEHTDSTENMYKALCKELLFSVRFSEDFLHVPPNSLQIIALYLDLHGAGS